VILQLVIGSPPEFAGGFQFRVAEVLLEVAEVGVAVPGIETAIIELLPTGVSAPLAATLMTENV
jgi:hypothetical protein